MKTPPILQVRDFRRAKDTTGRAESQVAVALVLHEGITWLIELSGPMAMALADELAQQAAQCMGLDKPSAPGGQS